VAKDKGPTSLYDLKTLTGNVEVETVERAAKFSTQQETFLKQYSEKHARIVAKCKDIQAKSHSLADDLFTVAMEVANLSELFKECDLPHNVFMYFKLGELIHRSGDFLIHQGELFKRDISDWL